MMPPTKTISAADYLALESRRRSEKQVQEALVWAALRMGYAVREFAKAGAHGRVGGIVPKSWPDMLLGKDGHCFGLEVKRWGRKATADQLFEHEVLRAIFGITVYIVHNEEEMLVAMALEAAGERVKWEILYKRALEAR